LVRINRLPREAAAIIILRRKQQSINQIANFLGRSYSFVYRILKKNLLISDLRKLPNRIKLLAAARQHQIMLKLWQKWQNFILGEGEKPP